MISIKTAPLPPANRDAAGLAESVRTCSVRFFERYIMESARRLNRVSALGRYGR